MPTLDAPVTVKVPPGTQTGKTVAGAATAASRGVKGAGALLVTVRRASSRRSSTTSRAAVESSRPRCPSNPREHLGV